MSVNARRPGTGCALSRVSAATLAAATAALLPVAMTGGPVAAAARAATALATPGPAGRVWDSWADDPATGQVVLFGGDQAYRTSGPDDVLGSTWAWDGTTWTRLHPATSPPPRDTHSLVYDPATGTAILFGGYNGQRLSDTWSWDGSTWTQLSPATSPPTVSTAWQAAYDAASQQLVLYGGDASTQFSNETWAWTGTTWTELTPAANAGRRAYGALTYDPALRRLVMFGGSNRTRDLTTLWEWNGTSWQQA